MSPAPRAAAAPSRRRPALVVAVAVLGSAAVAARAQESGSGPRLELSAASLSFSEPGEARALTLRNAGGGVLHVGLVSMVVTGRRDATDFGLDAAATHDLAAGESVTVNVTYRPVGALGAAGRRPSFAALLVPADDPRLPADIGAPSGTLAPRRIASVALRARETHLLTWIVALPLLGALLLALVGARRPRWTRGLAAVAAGVPLPLSLVALARFEPSLSAADGGFGLQLVAHRVLVRALDVEYFVGVDGLSIALVVLAALLGTFAAVGAAARGGARGALDDGAPAPQLAAPLVVQAGATGVFIALDGFLFWCFWLLAVGGAVALAMPALGAAAPPRATRRVPPFLLAAFAGAAILLVAVGALHGHSGAGYLADGAPAAHSFDLMKLAHANAAVDVRAAAPPARVFGLPLATVVFWALFAAFAMTAPFFPFHGAAVDVHERAPAGVSALLAGLLPAMAIYGLLRLALPLAPDAAQAAAPVVATLGAVGAVVAALLARAAPDVRRLFAYAGVARVGVCLVGLGQATAAGISGALGQVIGNGLAAALTFGLADAILARRATLAAVDGLAARAPRGARLLALASLASVGAPGLATFAGAALIVLDAFGRHAGLALASLAAFAITTGAHARLARRVLSSTPAETLEGAREPDGATVAGVLALGALTLALGLVPSWLVDLGAASVRDLVDLLAAPRG
jgi:NADH-quinone oxidoreductase subunit M